MFKVKSGMTRRAIFLGPIVLKFPHLTYGTRSFWTGVIANMSEFAIWKCLRGKATFLAPTLFTFFGLVNVQLCERGEMVSGKELEKRYKLLDLEARNLIPNLGGHALHPANWVKNEKGYVLVDYGDTFISEYIQISGFLQMFYGELSPILMAEPDESRLSERSLNELGYLRLMENHEWCYANDGKHIAISQGRLIAEADDRKKLVDLLHEMNITRMTRMAIVGEDEERPIEISTPFFD